MKQPFGAKPAGFCMRSMRWIAANPQERKRRCAIIAKLCLRWQEGQQSKQSRPS